MQHQPGNCCTYNQNEGNNESKVSFNELVTRGGVFFLFAGNIHHVIGKVNNPGGEGKYNIPVNRHPDSEYNGEGEHAADNTQYHIEAEVAEYLIILQEFFNHK